MRSLGKSTLSGSILYIMGMVDARTIERYEREAKTRNRESWFLAFIMDTSEEERAKGKTVEVGRAHFETAINRYTILDAPGHKNYVPNMIAGAAQADVGVLVISARKGEFETGFEKGGQTREHAMLAKTLGVQFLVVVINKMDVANENKTLAIVKKIKENDPKLEVMCISTKKNQNVSKLLTFIS
jgi:peptide chain release factor subunit 3